VEFQIPTFCRLAFDLSQRGLKKQLNGVCIEVEGLGRRLLCGLVSQINGHRPHMGTDSTAQDFSVTGPLNPPSAVTTPGGGVNKKRDVTTTVNDVLLQVLRISLARVNGD
jgi:hypothetical protein